MRRGTVLVPAAGDFRAGAGAVPLLMSGRAPGGRFFLHRNRDSSTSGLEAFYIGTRRRLYRRWGKAEIPVVKVSSFFNGSFGQG